MKLKNYPAYCGPALVAAILIIFSYSNGFASGNPYESVQFESAYTQDAVILMEQTTLLAQATTEEKPPEEGDEEEEEEEEEEEPDCD